jgi:Flp pilus assembly pilin Flp
MLNQIKRFMLDESGLETVEWAIVGGVITAGGVVLFFAIGLDANRGMTSLGGETSLIP